MAGLLCHDRTELAAVALESEKIGRGVIDALATEEPHVARAIGALPDQGALLLLSLIVEAAIDQNPSVFRPGDQRGRETP